MEASRDRQMGGLHFFLPSHFTILLITAPAQQHPKQDQVSDLQGTQVTAGPRSWEPGSVISESALKVGAEGLKESAPLPCQPTWVSHSSQNQSSSPHGQWCQNPGLRGAPGHPRSSDKLPPATGCSPSLPGRELEERSTQAWELWAQRGSVKVLGREFHQPRKGCRKAAPPDSASPFSLFARSGQPSSQAPSRKLILQLIC